MPFLLCSWFSWKYKRKIHICEWRIKLINIDKSNYLKKIMYSESLLKTESIDQELLYISRE